METIDTTRRAQDRDNYAWIRDAEQNALVVGTEARILYADAGTRVRIALEFNKLVREKKIGPVMLGVSCSEMLQNDVWNFNKLNSFFFFLKLPFISLKF